MNLRAPRKRKAGAKSEDADADAGDDAAKKALKPRFQVTLKSLSQLREALDRSALGPLAYHLAEVIAETNQRESDGIAQETALAILESLRDWPDCETQVAIFGPDLEGRPRIIKRVTLPIGQVHDLIQDMFEDERLESFFEGAELEADGDVDPHVGCLLLVFEGSDLEVQWMVQQLASEWHDVARVDPLSEHDVQTVWSRLVEFPCLAEHQLVVQASVPPSAVVDYVLDVEPQLPPFAVQAHAGNGIVYLALPNLADDGWSSLVTNVLRPAACRHGGRAVVWSAANAAEAERYAVWGAPSGPVAIMQRIKDQFDPHQILNPGRFVV